MPHQIDPSFNDARPRFVFSEHMEVRGAILRLTDPVTGQEVCMLIPPGSRTRELDNLLLWHFQSAWTE